MEETQHLFIAAPNACEPNEQAQEDNPWEKWQLGMPPLLERIPGPQHNLYLHRYRVPVVAIQLLEPCCIMNMIAQLSRNATVVCFNAEYGGPLKPDPHSRLAALPTYCEERLQSKGIWTENAESEACER
jgi:hypothetical protein